MKKYQSGFFKEKELNGEEYEGWGWIENDDSVFSIPNWKRENAAMYMCGNKLGLSPYTFLHGDCYLFALALNKIYGYPILIYRTPENFIHSFCQYKMYNQTFFIDVRGITTDIHDIFKDFEDFIDIDNINENMYVENDSYQLARKDLDKDEKEILAIAEEYIHDPVQIYDIVKFSKEIL